MPPDRLPPTDPVSPSAPTLPEAQLSQATASHIERTWGGGSVKAGLSDPNLEGRCAQAAHIRASAPRRSETHAHATSRCRRAGLAFVNAKVFRLKKVRDTQGLREKSHHQLAPAGKVGVPELRASTELGTLPRCSCSPPTPPPSPPTLPANPEAP